MTVEEIITGCQHKDRKAQALFLERYLGPMTAHCLRLISDVCKAQEIASDGILQCLLAIEPFEYSSDPETDGWVRTTMTNLCIRHLEKKKRKRKKIRFNATVKEEMLTAEMQLDNILNEEKEHLVEKVPEKYRPAYRLHVIHGFEYEEIAETLDITIDACYKHISRARKFLQAYF